MSGASANYKRIGVRTDNPTLKEVNDDLERHKRRHRWVVLLLLLLLLLLLPIVASYITWNIILTNNSNGQQGQINALQANATIIQNNLMQLILEFQGNVTLLQNGTLTWSLVSNTDLFDCVNNPPSNQGYITGTYELLNVEIASINYTMLKLYPPSTPLVYTTPITYPGVVKWCLTYFTPTLQILDTFADSTNPGYPYVLQFTASNLARIISTPDCLLSGGCYVIPYWGESNLGYSAYSVQKDVLGIPQPGDFYVEWDFQYTGPDPALNTTFTLSQPLQLILPSS
jgi:hypothetical protein